MVNILCLCLGFNRSPALNINIKFILSQITFVCSWGAVHGLTHLKLISSICDGREWPLKTLSHHFDEDLKMGFF